MHEPERDQLGERVFDFRAQHAGGVDDLVVEARAVTAAGTRATRDARGLTTGGSAGAGTARFHSARLRRGNSVTGVVRIGPTLFAAILAGAVSRVHTARPARHRSSSHVKS